MAKEDQFVLTGKGSIRFDGNVIRKGEIIGKEELSALPKRLRAYFEKYKKPEKPVNELKALEIAKAALEKKVADLQKINSEQQKKVEALEKEIAKLQETKPDQTEPEKK